MRSLRARGGFGGKTATQQKTVTQKTVTPTEADDTLHATEIAYVYDLLSEGPIVGLCDRNWNPLTNPAWWGIGVFFNETQLMTDGGQLTYADVSVGQAFGNDVQNVYTAMPPSASDTVSIGVQIYANQPITFGIEDPNTTRVAVGIRFPRLEAQDDQGNIGPFSVNFYIFISFNGGVFTAAGPGVFTVSGKCSSDFVQEYVIAMPKSTNPQADFWQIQVQRINPDDSDSKHSSVIILDYYTRIVDANLMYPGCAYIVTSINALALSSIPNRGFRVKGRYVLVPSNYFPDTRNYGRYYVNGGNTGVEQPWNGTFYAAWSNNPAWVFYDICTNTRYGAGEFIGANIDIWALYEIAQYCDELVPDGIGGYEPRFTLNTYIQTQEQAWKVLSDFASCFRGLIYWGGGTIVPVQDRPKPMMQVFTNSNVVGAVFSYSDTEIKNRQSDATVQWNDPDDFFNQKLERVTDTATRAQFGSREAQFTAFGCTSRGQAVRAGKYFLETNSVETETVVFQTGFEAVYLRPGDVIGIADNDRIGFRSGGRVVKVTPGVYPTVYITLDAPIPARADGTQIWFYAAQNATTSSDIAVGDFYASERAANNRPSMAILGYIFGMNGRANNVIFVDPRASQYLPPVGSAPAPFPVDQITTSEGPEIPFSNAVVPGSIWVLSHNYYTPTTLTLSLYRIIDISEKEQHIIQITGVTYLEGKYNEIDFGYQFQKPILTAIPPITYVLTPNNLTAKLKTVVTNETVVLYAEINWEIPPDPAVRSFRVFVGYNGGTFVLWQETQATTLDYPTPHAGLYAFRVQSVNFAAVNSAAVQASIQVPVTPNVIPHRVSGLELRGQGNNMIYINQDPVIDWRLNSLLKSVDMNSKEPYGANTGGYDPYFRNFAITIRDANTNKIGWTDVTTNLNYTILYTKNQKAWGDGNPRHRLTVEVEATNTYNIPAPIERITIDNPPPPPVQGLTAAVGSGRVSLQWIVAEIADLVRINIYMSITGLATGAVLVGYVAAHTDHFTSVPLTSGTYYWGVTQVDTFGNESVLTALIATTI